MAKMNPSRPAGVDEAPAAPETTKPTPEKTYGPIKDPKTGGYKPAAYKTKHGFTREDH